MDLYRALQGAESLQPKPAQGRIGLEIKRIERHQMAWVISPNGHCAADMPVVIPKGTAGWTIWCVSARGMLAHAAHAASGDGVLVDPLLGHMMLPESGLPESGRSLTQ